MSPECKISVISVTPGADSLLLFHNIIQHWIITDLNIFDIAKLSPSPSSTGLSYPFWFLQQPTHPHARPPGRTSSEKAGNLYNWYLHIEIYSILSHEKILHILGPPPKEKSKSWKYTALSILSGESLSVRKSLNAFVFGSSFDLKTLTLNQEIICNFILW